MKEFFKNEQVITVIGIIAMAVAESILANQQRKN